MSNPIATSSEADGSRRSREQAFAARVLAAREEERHRIARELHDDTSQALTSLMVGLETLHHTLDSDPRATHQRIETLSSIARDALSGISRLIRGLRPAALEQRDLLSALRSHAAHLEAIYGIQVNAQFSGSVPTRIDASVESGLYRMVQEAMTNAAKHALASEVSVTVHFRTGGLRALIEDDGVGFETDSDSSTIPEGDGVGLRGLSERATALGGRLSVDSTPGEGTQVAIDIPLPGGQP